MIEKPQDATRSNVQAVTMKRFDEVVMPRIAASLFGAIIVTAGLLLNLVALEIHGESRVIRELAQGGFSDHRAWNAFSSESRRVNLMRGGRHLPAQQQGRPG